MKIKSITINLFFKRVGMLRNKIEKIEKRFSENFIPPYSTALIPEEAPPAIARISTGSQLEALNISQINLSYSNNSASNNFDEIINEKIINNIIECIKEDLERAPLYFGLTAICDIDSEDPINEIKNKYLKLTDHNINELNLRYSVEKDNTYYINRTVSNTKEFEINFQVKDGESIDIIPEIISTSNITEKKHFIQLIVDINDRLAYNINESYNTDIDSIKKGIELLKLNLENNSGV